MNFCTRLAMSVFCCRLVLMLWRVFSAFSRERLLMSTCSMILLAASLFSIR
ncbi:Uncharacterised protein [Collinsella intestinalis]|nr:Uncharacterised protein [Collinsella intestinalis]